MQLAYCFGLKHQAGARHLHRVVGFLIRAIAGGAAASIPLSQWFLLVMAFGSLFMAAGKRYAELQLAERTGAKIRKSLESYTSTYLRFVWTLSATAVVVCYGLWAFERDDGQGSAGSRCRWFRSPSRSCGTRSTSTAAWPASPRTSRCSDRVLQLLCLGLDRNRRCRGPPRLTRSPDVARLAGLAGPPVGRPFRLRHDRSGSASGWACRGDAVLFGWGAWQRRWIADDGLIVLRTVRNLLAGNGPVFNAGERVEANTSTVWTYLIYFGRLARLAGAAGVRGAGAGSGASVAGVALLMLGTGRLYAPSLRGRPRCLLPAGALVYIAIPPARDFATSGLENGLVLAYLGLLWWMMVCWSQACARSRAAAARRDARTRGPRRSSPPWPSSPG